MALHCVYNSNSFQEALLLCANMRGDSDSVASVCGQIAGEFTRFYLRDFNLKPFDHFLIS